MKNGIAYITLTDGKTLFLMRKDKNSDPVVASVAASTVEEGLSGALNVAMDNGLTLDKAVVALDSRNSFLRNFRLPIQGKRQLDQVISFELDDDLPLDAEVLVRDHFRGSYSKGMSHVCAAALNKEIVSKVLEAFEEQDVEVQSIDLDAAAFARACSSQFKDVDRFVGLDIGQDRVLICLVVKGKTHMLSVTSWGESLLVEDISRQSGLGEADIDRLMVLGEGDDDSREALGICLDKFLNKILREVYRLLGEAEWPTMFVVSGEIVRVQAFRETFEKVSEGSLTIWEEACLKLGDELDDGQRGSGVAVGYGTAEESGGKFDFRKDEFSRAGGKSAMQREIFYVVGLLLAVALAWGGYAYANLMSGERELEYLREATLQQYRDAIPEVGNDMALMQYQSILSSKLELLTGTSNSGKDGDSSSVIDTLRTVSSVLAKNIDVEFLSLSMDAKRIDIQGQTRTMKEVDTVRASLVKTKAFKSVKVKNAVTEKRTKRIRFEIEVIR